MRRGQELKVSQGKVGLPKKDPEPMCFQLLPQGVIAQEKGRAGLSLGLWMTRFGLKKQGLPHKKTHA